MRVVAALGGNARDAGTIVTAGPLAEDADGALGREVLTTTSS